MWLHGVIAVLLVGVSNGHPHHDHDTPRSQDVQGHDRRPPPLLMCPPKSVACCEVPILIEEADLKEAGFEGQLIPPPPPPLHRHQSPPPPHELSPPNRDGPPSYHGPPHHDEEHFNHRGRMRDHHHFSCEKEKCIFNKLDWLTDNTTLNTEALTAYFSEWASAHEGWLSAPNLVVQNCLSQEVDEDAPPEMCIEMKTIFCFMETLLQNCPSNAWTNSERCDSLKKASECHDRKYRPPLHLLAECCAVPDVVKKTKLTECGKGSLLPPPPSHHHHHGPPHGHGPPHHHGPPHDHASPHHHGPAPPHHHGPPPPNDHAPPRHGPGCDRHWALFEKLGWLNENRTLKSEAYGKHIKTWLSQHHAWSDVKDKVLDICAQDEPEIHMCLPHRILICTQRVLAENCPDSSWKSSKMCEGGPPTSNPTSPDQPGVSVTDPINEDQANQGESIAGASIEEIEEDLDSLVENVDVGVNVV